MPAPTFWAPSADTVDSIEDGTRKMKLMIFSTMPTAAASVRPRRLAMTVMSKNEIWISPSCKATGTPMLAAQATAIKYIGLRESPSPRKMDAIILYAVIQGMPMKQMVR